jgi:phosphate transport system substrate-binding protein
MKYFLLVLVALIASGNAVAREQIKIVGSSTVYPFSSFVAEEFGSVSRYPTPVVESTGTGGGMKLFCSGNGENTPDITNASRRIKLKEYYLCERNGVTNITEIMFGYDGIVIAQAETNADMNITRQELLLAVAKKVPSKDNKSLIDNPYKYWNEINPSLPNRKIAIYGPPISSGTRDAFEEIILQYQTEEMKVYRDAGLKGYRVIRTDGVYIPSGENDNLIVKKLTKDTSAVGIFGYSFLAENTDSIEGVAIDGIMPEADNIATKLYPISRSLFIYIKNDHINEVPAISEYIKMFLNPDIIGEEGLLTEMGLIPMDEDMIVESQDKFRSLVKVNDDELKLALRHHK